MSEAQIQELFRETLRGDYEDEAPWEAVCKLRYLGTREVFNIAREWCSSEDPLKRARGIDVLAQLGKTADHPINSFSDESYSVVTNLLHRETEIRPLSSAVAALGHLDDPRAILIIARFCSHPNSEIRFSVACALGSIPNDPLIVEELLVLMADPDEDVRDWATFGLGVLGNVDSPEIREALGQRLHDENEDVREEAMVSLGKRENRRVLSPMLAALDQATVSDRVIEAAYLMLGMENEPQGWTPTNYAEALRIGRAVTVVNFPYHLLGGSAVPAGLDVKERRVPGTDVPRWVLARLRRSDGGSVPLIRSGREFRNSLLCPGLDPAAATRLKPPRGGPVRHG